MRCTRSVFGERVMHAVYPLGSSHSSWCSHGCFVNLGLTCVFPSYLPLGVLPCVPKESGKETFRPRRPQSDHLHPPVGTYHALWHGWFLELCCCICHLGPGVMALNGDRFLEVLGVMALHGDGFLQLSLGMMLGSLHCTAVLCRLPGVMAL
ncbi:hypothetical protein NDU88_000386 [Pleurodeles waltl]|uniref:Uncharacterized protein n=1 Tax=Pleurodeles waltl TaxID=8319 RepID=A0AAV7LA34_PLEWA|nr:hypothetical protein NDU88_000386 [Pleurodeles waltl]